MILIVGDFPPHRKEYFMKYIFLSKLCNDPLFIRNGEVIEVIKKGYVFSKVRFESDGMEIDIYTNEVKEFCEDLKKNIFGEKRK